MRNLKRPSKTAAAYLELRHAWPGLTPSARSDRVPQRSRLSAVLFLGFHSSFLSFATAVVLHFGFFQCAQGIRELICSFGCRFETWSSRQRGLQVNRYRWGIPRGIRIQDSSDSARVKRFVWISKISEIVPENHCKECKNLYFINSRNLTSTWSQNSENHHKPFISVDTFSASSLYLLSNVYFSVHWFICQSIGYSSLVAWLAIDCRVAVCFLDCISPDP